MVQTTPPASRSALARLGGRPGGFRLDSRQSAAAVRFTQRSAPNGLPRSTLCRGTCSNCAQLVPDKSVVELDSVLFEKRSKLILARHFLVMLLLVLDVEVHRLGVGLAHRECRVACLPLKVLELRTFDLHPLRATLLYLLDNLLESVILRKREQCVDVIGDAADLEGGTFPGFKDPRLVRPQTFPVFFWDPGMTALGAVDKVHQVLHQRLGHSNTPES